MSKTTQRPNVIRHRKRGADGPVEVVEVRNEQPLDLTKTPWTRGTRASQALVQRLLAAIDHFNKVLDGKTPLNMTLYLREIQRQAVRDALAVANELAGHVRHESNGGGTRSPFSFCRVVMPPRTGKRLIFGYIAAAMGVPTLVLTDTKSLALDHFRDLQQQFPELSVGIRTREYKNPTMLGITCSTYGTLQRAHASGRVPAWMRNIQLVIMDEGHVPMTKERIRALREVFHWTAWRIAFTVTPDNSQDRILADHFPKLIREVTLQEARRRDLIARAREVPIPRLRRRGRIAEEKAVHRYRRWAWLIDPWLDPYNRRAVRAVIESQLVISEFAPPKLEDFKNTWFYTEEFEGSGRMLLRYCGYGLRGPDYRKFMLWLYPHLMGDLWLRKKTGRVQVKYDERPNIDDDIRHMLENVPRHPSGMEYGWRALFGPDEHSQSPEGLAMYREMLRDVTWATRTLTPRQERVIVLIFGLDHVAERTLREVGDDFGVTCVCIQQLRDRALKRLKRLSRPNRLQPHYDD